VFDSRCIRTQYARQKWNRKTLITDENVLYGKLRCGPHTCCKSGSAFAVAVSHGRQHQNTHAHCIDSYQQQCQWQI